LPFCTSRHEHDARWWRERFASVAGKEAREAVSVLRREIAERAAKPLPANAWMASRQPRRIRSCRGGFDSAHNSYADFLALALSDGGAWPRDPEARYLELTTARPG
jgi:hypothetical protein